LTKYTIQWIFRICEYFSEICFWIFVIADALFKTTAEKFFDPTADIIWSILFSKILKVWLIAVKLYNE